MFSANFSPKKDHLEDEVALSDCDFLPRSSLHYPVGAITTSLGLPSWWRVGNFEERIQTMVDTFDFRAAVRDPCLNSSEHQIVKYDAALIYRLNDRSRNAAPATKWANTHYQTNMPMYTAPAERLAELILNASFVRNTLSTRVRTMLAKNVCCWLKLAALNGSVANKTVVDAFVVQCGGKEVFGEFANPMRIRGEPKEGGTLDLSLIHI